MLRRWWVKKEEAEVRDVVFQKGESTVKIPQTCHSVAAALRPDPSSMPRGEIDVPFREDKVLCACLRQAVSASAHHLLRVRGPARLSAAEIRGSESNGPSPVHKRALHPTWSGCGRDGRTAARVAVPPCPRGRVCRHVLITIRGMIFVASTRSNGKPPKKKQTNTGGSA